MKRLVVITVGKTHSGKTTFARALEEKLNNSIVIDQDNHASFINKYYKNLQPKQGPNTLKHSLSKLIVDYVKESTNFHLIICNSNRSRSGREYLMEEFFHPNEFIRILVHFDIPDDILIDRVQNSTRNTNIFRGSYSSFEEVLVQQQAASQNEEVQDPTDEEADYLFVIKENKEVEDTIDKILKLAE